jgi:hypothetical protein
MSRVLNREVLSGLGLNNEWSELHIPQIVFMKNDGKVLPRNNIAQRYHRKLQQFSSLQKHNAETYDEGVTQILSWYSIAHHFVQQLSNYIDRKRKWTVLEISFSEFCEFSFPEYVKGPYIYC